MTREGKGMMAMKGRGDVVADSDAGKARVRQMAMRGGLERRDDEMSRQVAQDGGARCDDAGQENKGHTNTNETAGAGEAMNGRDRKEIDKRGGRDERQERQEQRKILQRVRDSKREDETTREARGRERREGGRGRARERERREARGEERRGEARVWYLVITQRTHHAVDNRNEP